MLYDYECTQCLSEEKDWISSVDERDNQKCPKCGELMKRLVNAGQNVIFGEGFLSPGDIRRAECVITGKDGKKRTVDMRNML